jgi:integrase
MIRVYVIPPHKRSSNYRLRWQMGRKWCERTSGADNPRDAQKAALALEGELNAGRATSGQRLSWDEFCVRYEREHLAGLAAKTWAGWNTARNHVNALLGWRWLDEANHEALSVFVGMLRKSKISESSIATHVRSLRSALNWAADMRLLPLRISFKPPKRGRKDTQMRSRPISPVEFVTMCCMIPSVRPDDAPEWERLLMGIWLSGLRLGEVPLLSWEGGTPIAVDLSGRHPRFRIWAEGEKGRKNRYLPMTPDFAYWLLQTPESHRHGLVFKLPMRTPGNIGKVVSAIGRAAGVVVNDQGKHATIHDLRRSFGTRWASRVKPTILMLLMRHESIQTTMGFYVAHDADDVAADLYDLPIS